MKRFKVKIVVVVVILIVMVPKHSWNKEYKLYATAQRKTSGTTSNLQQQSKNTREREGNAIKNITVRTQDCL